MEKRKSPLRGRHAIRSTRRQVAQTRCAHVRARYADVSSRAPGPRGYSRGLCEQVERAPCLSFSAATRIRRSSRYPLAK